MHDGPSHGHSRGAEGSCHFRKPCYLLQYFKYFMGDKLTSHDYRRFVRTIIRNSIKKKFPGLKQLHINELATEASVAIHARFYGTAVDGVASPIWRDDPNYARGFTDAQPTKTAQELLDA